MDLTIGDAQRGDVTLLRLQGRVHGGTADRLEERLLTGIDAGERRFALDCSQLDYISSAGVRVLSVLRHRLETIGGRLVFFNVDGNVQDILTITGLAAVFPSYGTEEDALSQLRGE